MTKVHMIMLLVIDHDDIGAAEAKVILENQRYPNHCMAPRVIAIDTREVEWSDDHPLNQTRSMQDAALALFAARGRET
jgi:hypothetical protein